MNYDIKFSIGSDFEVKEAGSDFVISGYGAVFGNIDSYRDIIQQGAFKKTLNDMKDRIAFCYQHDIYNPIGKIQEIKEDMRGLWLKVKVSDAEPEIKQKLKEGILKELSIGYRTVIDEYDRENDIRTLKEVMLYEVSLVTIAANSEAVLDPVKSQFGEVDIEAEFDRIIALERNHKKHFELLKLKSFCLSLIPEKEPDVSTQIEDEPKAFELNYNINLKK